MGELKARVGVLLVTVRDFPRMLAFYRDTLGLAVSAIDPGSDYRPLQDWVQFQLDGVAIELFAESRTPGPPRFPLPRQNAVCIAFRVDDIHAAYSELAARGMAFARPVRDEDWGWYAHFLDPEGNRLQLYQSRPGFESPGA